MDDRSSKGRRLARAAGHLLAIGSLACSSQFAPQSEVGALRVLAIQKDSPYALPGDDVDFTMLWHDSAPGAGRRIERMWLSGCVNPPGDSFLVCLKILEEAVARGAGPLLDQALATARATPNAEGSVTFTIPAEALAGLSGGGAGGGGTTDGSAGAGASFDIPAFDFELTLQIDDASEDYVPFTYHVPENILLAAPPPKDPKVPPYGLSFVYYAACAGELGAAPAGTEGLVIVCKDGDELLRSEDYVFGYSQLYVYEDHDNENPVITGVRFDGDLRPDDLPEDALCFDPNSVSVAGEGEGMVPCRPVTNRPRSSGGSRADGGVDVDAGFDEEPLRRPCSDIPADVHIPNVPRCTKTNRMECPKHDIRLEIDESQAENDSVQQVIRQEPLPEQMWINYFTDAGSVASEARVLNDATAGWNEKHETQFVAPETPGLVYLWASPHDNRGGVGWARFAVCIE